MTNNGRKDFRRGWCLPPASRGKRFSGLLHPPTAIPQLKEIPMDFFFLVSITLRAFFRRGWCLPPASRGKRFSGLLHPPTANTPPKEIPMDFFFLVSITFRALLNLRFRNRD